MFSYQYEPLYDISYKHIFLFAAIENKIEYEIYLLVKVMYITRE